MRKFIVLEDGKELEVSPIYFLEFKQMDLCGPNTPLAYQKFLKKNNLIDPNELRPWHSFVIRTGDRELLFATDDKKFVSYDKYLSVLRQYNKFITTHTYNFNGGKYAVETYLKVTIW